VLLLVLVAGDVAFDTLVAFAAATGATAGTAALIVERKTKNLANRFSNAKTKRIFKF
jgi:hypothetical protein